MDYKNIYLNTFNKKMKEIDADVISQLKNFKERNKDFTALANQIAKDLRVKENNKKTILLHHFPDLYTRYSRRFDEYDSDHLTSYFLYDYPDLYEKYSRKSLEECAIELAIFESYSKAAVNFSNSDKFLKAIYALNKNYEHYTLNFDPNLNPVDSDLFHQMQKERFPGYGEEVSFEVEAIKEIQSDPTRELVSNLAETLKDLSPQKKPNTRIEKEDNIETQIKAIDPSVKLYLLRQLYHLPRPINDYFSIPEFMKLIKILESSFDTSIFQKKPANVTAYRPINKGLSYYQHSSGEKIKSDAIKYLDQYGLKSFKEYITFHSK